MRVSVGALVLVSIAACDSATTATSSTATETSSPSATTLEPASSSTTTTPATTTTPETTVTTTGSTNSASTTSTAQSTTVATTTTTSPTTTSTLIAPIFASADISVGAAELTVLLADTPRLRRLGLMGVERLPSGIDGMLFIFDQAAEVNFTMRDTLIPLDIWWIDGGGEVVGTTAMEPCTEEPCPLYPSPGEVLYALETPSGSLQIEVGSEVVIDG